MIREEGKVGLNVQNENSFRLYVFFSKSEVQIFAPACHDSEAEAARV